MRIRIFFTLAFAFAIQMAFACPACEKQQPAITKGLTHGAGPQSNWDWVIIVIIVVITVLTFVFSLKYLIKPGENNPDHIKQSILTN
ncbi:MAG: hypothetical protein ABIV51_07920 [Saprospiraceae bacterium]